MTTINTVTDSRRALNADEGRLLDALSLAPEDGFTVDWRHDAGGVMVDANFDADTTDEQIREVVDDAKPCSDFVDRDAALEYWQSARDAARESREHMAEALRRVKAAEFYPARAAYEAAAECEARFGDRPSFPRVQ